MKDSFQSWWHSRDNVTLTKIVLAVSLLSIPESFASETSPVSREVGLPENFEHSLNLAILRAVMDGPQMSVPAARGFSSVVADFLHSEREGLPSVIFKTLSTDKGDESLAKRFAFRLASESGKLDARDAARMLMPPSADKTEQIDEAVYLVEAAANFSPSTFSGLIAELEEARPEIVAAVLSKAVIPFTTLRDSCSKLNPKDQARFAEIVSTNVLNGTNEEICAALALFSDPTKLAPETAARLVLAGALVSTETVDGWLAGVDAKTRNSIFKALPDIPRFDHMLPPERRTAALGLRAQRVISSKFFAEDADPSAFQSIVQLCSDQEALSVLVTAAERFKNAVPRSNADARARILSQIARIHANYGEIPMLISGIEKGAASNDFAELGANIDAFIRAHREKAVKYMNESTNAEVRKQMEERLLMAGEYTSTPEKRMEFLKGVFKGKNDEASLSEGLMHQLGMFVYYEARFDRPQAAVFLDGLPEGVTKASAIEAFAKEWVKEDPARASDWIATLPPSSNRDLALKELIIAAEDDPEMAFANSAAIGDQEIRRTAASAVVDRWKSLNPDAISPLIQASPLSAEDKTVLIQRLTAPASSKGTK
ncbi:MAG: hypothetical protein V4710_17365 [Verrucomicrobiota bacterium]